MTDRDLMVERIQAAMQAVDKAHEAKENLLEKADKESLAKFQAQMKELEDHLRLMKQILDHEDLYTIDEIADALSHALDQKSGSYHRIPHYETSIEKK